MGFFVFLISFMTG
jgi:hypothetical protein